MEKLFETKNGSILYYDGASRKLIAKNSDVADILASLKEDANSINPVDRMFAEGFLADIEKLGITTQEF